jgi:hypothetical protein
MYTQYFLKFATQEECYEALTSVDWYGQVAVADGEPRYGFTLSGHVGSIDEVGLVVGTPATYDEVTFEEISPVVYIDGWHVNIVTKEPLPEALEQYIVTPSTPQRVFAGF